MSRQGVRARTLSVFLLKTDFSEPEKALLDRSSLDESKVIAEGAEIGLLYVKPSYDRIPSWLSMFEGGLQPRPSDVHNASTAGVFFTRAGDRTFALTFGYGRTLLRPSSWEEDFGLKVTLNSVDPAKIRSVDRVKFDSISQHSQIQASRDATIVEFGLDVEQDLLRAVTGKPSGSMRELGNQLTGKDALKADVQIELAGVPALLARYLEAFRLETYKENFPWVDHVGEVRDVGLVQKLDATMVDRVARGDFEHTWLAIPDRIDWEGMAGFKYRESKKAPLHFDVHFPTFIAEEGLNFVPTIENFKNRRRIHLMSHEAELSTATWTLYRCIYCEIDSDNQTYLLNNGKWYRIKSDFLQAVNDSFNAVLSQQLRLPDYSHSDEGAYNAHVATTGPATFCLMDQKFIRYPTNRDQIEFCDLYSRSKQIIHVKRYRGSATLSHLFSQGVVSAELFCAAAEFREGVNEHLPTDFQLADISKRPASEEFEIVFAIVSKSKNPLTLPFFSRVNLRNAVQRLRAYGYRASITKVLDIRPSLAVGIAIGKVAGGER